MDKYVRNLTRGPCILRGWNFCFCDLPQERVLYSAVRSYFCLVLDTTINGQARPSCCCTWVSSAMARKETSFCVGSHTPSALMTHWSHLPFQGSAMREACSRLYNPDHFCYLGWADINFKGHYDAFLIWLPAARYS